MMMPKSDLVHGKYYFGRCRNARVARWNEKQQVFLYHRNKFGHWFLEEIKHPEDDQVYDVFVVEREATPEEIAAIPGGDIDFVGED